MQKAKQRKKVALGGMKGDTADVSDPNLFGLANVRGDKDMLAGLSDAAAPGLIAASIAEREGDGDSSDDGGEQRDEWDLESDATDSDADSDAEREKHVRRMEKYIDKLYDHYDKCVLLPFPPFPIYSTASALLCYRPCRASLPFYSLLHIEPRCLVHRCP